MKRSRSQCSIGLTLAALVSVALVFSPTPAHGQRLKKNANTPKAAPARQTQPGDEKSKARPVDLESVDGVLVAATYFPSSAGKNAPIVLVLHGFGENQEKFWELAYALKDGGYAVMTLDFRGHGHSTSIVREGADKISFRDLGRKIKIDSLTNDLEAVKSFLIERNNTGELNLSKLGIVGSGMGANIGVLYAFHDWSRPERVGFQDKQAHNVQSLVLISPSFNFKGLSVARQLSAISSLIPIQVVVGGEDRKALSDAKKMFQTARRGLPESSRLVDLETSLQGSKLLAKDLNLGVEKDIVSFLDKNLKRRILKWETHQPTE